jgi:hypothetical protein
MAQEEVADGVVALDGVGVGVVGREEPGIFLFEEGAGGLGRP